MSAIEQYAPSFFLGFLALLMVHRLLVWHGQWKAEQGLGVAETKSISPATEVSKVVPVTTPPSVTSVADKISQRVKALSLVSEAKTPITSAKAPEPDLLAENVKVPNVNPKIESNNTPVESLLEDIASQAPEKPRARQIQRKKRVKKQSEKEPVSSDGTSSPATESELTTE